LPAVLTHADFIAPANLFPAMSNSELYAPLAAAML